MIEKIQHATASSPEGAKGLVKGVLACAFQNMAFMLPTCLLYFLVKDLLNGTTSGKAVFYLLGCIVCFGLILLTTWFQYNGTYFTTYKESGIRRLALAERLRKLPLSFFGKRDLADLTSTIMSDCEVLEKTCSHFIPGLFGSLISTVIIALSLFAFDWRMALAALWVIPVSIAIVLGSYRVQDRIQARTMAVKMDCADGIQEYIETLRDLKASNAEQGYLSGLSKKIRAVEKQSVAAELETALFVSSASMVLKLGIASVALTGSVLLVQGSIDVISGREGRAYAKINGNNEELFFAKSVEASVEKSKSEVKAIGKRMTGHKTTGANGTGSMTLYYLTPLLRQMLKEWKDTGVDVYFDLVVENDDPASSAGKQSILLMGCNLDSVVLTKLDGDSDDPLEEDADFTFEDFDILEAFNKI